MYHEGIHFLELKIGTLHYHVNVFINENNQTLFCKVATVWLSHVSQPFFCCTETIKMLQSSSLNDMFP